MPTVAGIEEAGRGPVIGPMVMCGILVDEADEKKLKEIGAKDSKLLTPKQREALFDRILQIAKKHEIVIIQPETIDNAVRDPAVNLNRLEAFTTARLLDRLRPDKAILDCPSTNIRAYSSLVESSMEHRGVKIIAEHKADVNYPVVSAASIIAKVTRDREIEKIKKKIGVDFGSGYPADPSTREFLKKNWSRYPDIFRKSWSSYRAVAFSESQKSLGGFQ